MKTGLPMGAVRCGYVWEGLSILPMTPQHRGSPSSQMALQEMDVLRGRGEAGRVNSGA